MVVLILIPTFCLEQKMFKRTPAKKVQNNLAIVIPAYKADFLKQTLESIKNQTNKNFTLYIGDDASPYDLKNIVNEFTNSINIVYKRFENNLGGKDLVRQWERCIELSSDEEWIWLFSDDDLMSPYCVQSFYDIKKQREVDLYRFDIKMIDENNHVSFISESPEFEGSIDFIKSRFKFERSSAVTNYIFSREIYESENHFNNFPLAWCTDDAAWLKFGRERGICTIKGNHVSWRNSAFNVSNNILTKKNNKIQAQIQFLKWLYTYNFEYLDSELFDNIKVFRQFSYSWLFDITFKLNLSYFQIIQFSFLVSKLYQTSPITEFVRYCNNKPIIKVLKYLKNSLR